MSFKSAYQQLLSILALRVMDASCSDVYEVMKGLSSEDSHEFRLGALLWLLQGNATQLLTVLMLTCGCGADSPIRFRKVPRVGKYAVHTDEVCRRSNGNRSHLPGTAQMHSGHSVGRHVSTLLGVVVCVHMLLERAFENDM